MVVQTWLALLLQLMPENLLLANTFMIKIKPRIWAYKLSLNVLLVVLVLMLLFRAENNKWSKGFLKASKDGFLLNLAT